MPATRRADRTRLRQGDRITVENWHDLGDAWEEQAEDGPFTRCPDHRPVVVLTTARGELYVLDYPFGGTRSWGWFPSQRERLHTDPMWVEAAETAREMAWRIRTTGSVNLARWSFLRATYGSEAYEADGYARLDKRLDFESPAQADYYERQGAF
jgi:hypothetical protein